MPVFEKPSDLVAGLPQFWGELIKKSLNEAPAERFQSVEEMLEIFLIRVFNMSFGR